MVDVFDVKILGGGWFQKLVEGAQKTSLTLSIMDTCEPLFMR